ncbi:hypothetical protein JCM11491_000061 [Sporobolomyces phaffii]
MSDIQRDAALPTAIESTPVARDPTTVHSSVQAHLDQEHSTRCGPQGEAHYQHWTPNDHVQHKKYDDIYDKMQGQDPHDVERYEHILHSPHVSTEAKVNAIEAMELPHTDQRCDLVNR